MTGSGRTKIRSYETIPTIKRFHESPAQIRCLVGPVGSGKTTGAAWELCYYLPYFMMERYGIKNTRWVVVRNTYQELLDTTQATLFEWFDWGKYLKTQKKYQLVYPGEGPVLEILFRSCDTALDVKKFKSLDLTGYWIDESIEVDESVKLMLKNRIGRYPSKCPAMFGIETTNPPDVEHPVYSQFEWYEPPPGPVPKGTPLKNHKGFWQPPGENAPNLRPGYYDDLRSMYADNQDWVDMYIDAKPGVISFGKTVYANFERERHLSVTPIIWSGSPLYRGWDNSGICPACVVVDMPAEGCIRILAEFHTEKMGIVDFSNYVISMCNRKFPGAMIDGEWGDPAGAARFSASDGGFTSNAELMIKAAGIVVTASEQNVTARLSSVDDFLSRDGGLIIDPECVRLINGFLGGYCYKKLPGGEYSDQIVKNRFSHVHDALQYITVKLSAKALNRVNDNFTPIRKHNKRQFR